MGILYRAAQITISAGRLLTATIYFLTAIAFMGFALWLLLPLGQSWPVVLFAVFVGLLGFFLLISASEIFLTTRAPERTAKPHQRDERQLQRPRRQH